MSKLNRKQQWITMAVVPLFSMAVMVGCGSDSDDPPAVDPVEVPDENDNGLPDAFDTEANSADDTNGNSISDDYDVLLTGGDDANTNGVDDSFEVEVTGGTDANNDGIDDAAAATLAGGGEVETVPDANGNGVPDAFEAEANGADDTNGNSINDAYDALLTGGDDTNTNDIDDSFEVALTGGTDANNDGIDDAAAATLAGGGGEGETVDQTGDLDDVNISNGTGLGDFAWDGNTLSGTVNIEDGVSVNSVSIQSGIFSSGNGQTIVTLNGSSPTFSFPQPMTAEQNAAIAENIISGNLFVNAQLSDGSNEFGTILLSGVKPKFSGLSATNNISGETEAFSNGAGYININTLTGDMTAVVKVNLNPADTDAEGIPETVGAVHIHEGAADEEGGVLVTLELSADGTVYTAQTQLDPTQRTTILEGNSYFNVHRTDQSNFMRGQIAPF